MIINPQALNRNCCLLDFQSSTKRHYLSPKPNKSIKNSLKPIQKKSLKPYRSMKHLMESQLTRVSLERPESPTKTIINELYEAEKNVKINLYSVKKSQIHQTSIIHTTPTIRYFTSPFKVQSSLMKAKSLTKINFKYPCVQSTYIPARKNNEYEQIQQSNQITIENIKSLHKISMVSECKSIITFHKKEEDEDLRSTMQPFLQIPKYFPAKAKSIVSIQDEQEIEDLMEESFILEKHSNNRIMQKLV